MFVLIGSEGNKLESLVAKRFGHAEYFIVYNTEINSFETFENLDEGHNHKNLQKFLEKGVEAFIVGNIGPHAFEIINTPKTSVYLARKMTVQEAIEKFRSGVLQKLTEPTAKRSIGHSHHDNKYNKGEHYQDEHHGKGHHHHE